MIEAHLQFINTRAYIFNVVSASHEGFNMTMKRNGGSGIKICVRQATVR